jgi:hypothetical protein
MTEQSPVWGNADSVNRGGPSLPDCLSSPDYLCTMPILFVFIVEACLLDESIELYPHAHRDEQFRKCDRSESHYHYLG